MSKSQRTANTGTSSRSRHSREPDVGGSSTATPPRFTGENDWETKEALCQRELEEARARAAQMEKTMKWWSDCTANWREKWSKVRNERNKARQEARSLRNTMDLVLKEITTLRNYNSDLETQNEQLRKALQKIYQASSKHSGQFARQILAVLEFDQELKNALELNELFETCNAADKCEISSPLGNSHQKDLITRKSPLAEELSTDVELENNAQAGEETEEWIFPGAPPKHPIEFYKGNLMGSFDEDVLKTGGRSTSKKKGKSIMSPVSLYEEDLSGLYIDADANKPEWAYSDKVNEKIEKRQSSVEIEPEEYKYWESQPKLLDSTDLDPIPRESIEKRKSVEIEPDECKYWESQTKLSSTEVDPLSKVSNSMGIDLRLYELRAELERLQAENAAEWGKRERLESEKLALERENKKLKNEIRELQERIESRRGRPVSSVHMDSSSQEIVDQNKELRDLKHSYGKLKKVLAEKTEELLHALRRSERYEVEVKKVRIRVDELKRELTGAQDEVDVATNSVKKLQRLNEDLVEQLESANVQIEHFKNSTEHCVSDVGTETTDVHESGAFL